MDKFINNLKIILIIVIICLTQILINLFSINNNYVMIFIISVMSCTVCYMAGNDGLRWIK